MFEGAIDCDQLGIVPDIPAELTQLQKDNTALQQSNRLLKSVLILAGLGISIYAIAKIIHDGRKEKEKRTGRA